MKYMLLGIGLFVIIACHRKSEEHPDINAQDEMLDKIEFKKAQTSEATLYNTDQKKKTLNDKSNKSQKIIKTGNINIEVINLDEAKIHIDTILSILNAYYEKESYRTNQYQSSYKLKIRIPVLNFEKLVSHLQHIQGKMTTKDIKAHDVGEEYIDIQTRLLNNRAYLARYINLLAKANSIKNIIEIQEKIREIEEEIESKEGRLQFLDDQTQYSTLHIQLLQTHHYVVAKVERQYGKQLVMAFKSGLELLLNFILGLVHLWPLLVLMLTVFVLQKRIKLIFKRNK